jgi:hypothetical protein
VTWAQVRGLVLGTVVIVIDTLIARPLFAWLDRGRR